MFVADRSGPAPLLLSSHGFTSTAEGQRETMLSDEPTPEDAGYTVVYPNAFASDVQVEPVDQGWNAGTCCGTPAMNGRDDVAFFRALVEEVSTLTCIDRKRIYATGMSNGGFISHRLACEASDLVAAVVSMAGVLGLPASDCNPSRPIPVMQIHGTADRVVPFEGGQTVGIAPFAGVQETIDTWKAKNGCSGEPVETYRRGTASCSTYDDCNGGADLVDCRIDGFDHCWAGAPSCSIGEPTADLSANERMLSFFERFELP